MEIQVRFGPAGLDVSSQGQGQAEGQGGLGGVSGVLHLPETGAAPHPVAVGAVVLLHGYTGSRVEDGRIFVLLGRALEAVGIACLRFDFRGSGESCGDFSQATLASEVEDAQAAFAFLATRREIDTRRLGLLGLSLGSVVAQRIAADVQVAALVLWATITHPSTIFPDDRGATLRGFPASASFLEQIRHEQPLDHLARYRGPLLCVHGAEDFVPLAQAEAAVNVVNAHAASGQAARLAVVADAPHVFGPADKKAQALALTRDFFSRHLAT